MGGFEWVLACCVGMAPQAWRPAEYPIGYWFGPLAEHNTREHWQRVADCGFTLGGMQGYGREGNQTMLDHCAAVGLKAVVIDDRIGWRMTTADAWRDTIAEVVADYGSHPGLYGYYVQDEPNSQIFAPLAELTAELMRQDPAHVPLLNLFPTYASVEQLGNPTYADHLEQFCSIVKPPFLSYDHYALLRDGRDRTDYFENMELVGAAALRHGIPPWYILLSISHFGYRSPSDGEMRWQVYTALAYGMKGLLYFTYATVPEWAAEGHLAIVDPDGNPAPLYPIVQKLNGEIAALGATLLGLTSTAVYHTGDIPAGCTRLAADALVTVEGEPRLVLGFFQDEQGRDWLMVTNKDYANPVEATLRLKPHVVRVALQDEAGGPEEVLAVQAGEATQRSEPGDAGRPAMELRGGTMTLRVPPGTGRLMRLETEFAYPRLPEPKTTIAFEFDDPAELRDWQFWNSLSEPSIDGGLLSATIIGDDPFFGREYLDIEPDRYSAVRVRMKLPPCRPDGQLFWTTAAEPGFSDTKYLNFSVEPDGAWHDYVVPVGEHDKWRGQRIRGLRLDPTVGGAEPGSVIEIDFVRGE